MSGRKQARLVEVTADEYAVLQRITDEIHDRARLLAGGSICPCCSGLVRAYKRHMNRRMALIVLRMYRDDREWVRSTDLRGDNHEISQLAWWGLVESDDDRWGYWRLTHLGRAFAEGVTTIESTMTVFNGKPIGRSTEDITISDALGVPFSYNELIYGEIPDE